MHALVETLLQFWRFLRDRKRYWLLPVIIVLVLTWALVFWLGRTALAPFVYTLF